MGSGSRTGSGGGAGGRGSPGGSGGSGSGGAGGGGAGDGTGLGIGLGVDGSGAIGGIVMPVSYPDRAAADQTVGTRPPVFHTACGTFQSPKPSHDGIGVPLVLL